MDMKHQAAFFRVAGDSVVEKVVLVPKIGYNHMRGWGVANLGRLRKTGTDLYNCFPRNPPASRIGDMRLSPRLEPEDLFPGIPILSGELVWSDRLIVSRGIAPVLDLSDGAPAQLEEVFDDGGLRGPPHVATARPGEGSVEQFEIYDADGPRGAVEIRAAPPIQRPSPWAKARSTSSRRDAIYQLEFDGKSRPRPLLTKGAGCRCGSAPPSLQIEGPREGEHQEPQSRADSGLGLLHVQDDHFPRDRDQRDLEDDLHVDNMFAQVRLDRLEQFEPDQDQQKEAEQSSSSLTLTRRSGGHATSLTMRMPSSIVDRRTSSIIMNPISTRTMTRSNPFRNRIIAWTSMESPSGQEHR